MQLARIYAHWALASSGCSCEFIKNKLYFTIQENTKRVCFIRGRPRKEALSSILTFTEILALLISSVTGKLSENLR